MQQLDSINEEAFIETRMAQEATGPVLRDDMYIASLVNLSKISHELVSFGRQLKRDPGISGELSMHRLNDRLDMWYKTWVYAGEIFTHACH